MSQDEHWMKQALELAAQAQGAVEPNPMVGCVLVKDGQEIASGYHRRYGDLHAETDALQRCEDPRGATAYVTLEPCCHQGKQPPCTRALIKAGVAKVVIATIDPFAKVAGAGLTRLQEAGIEVQVGVLAEEAQELNAPYFKLIGRGRPWIIAKWAATLDGKLATRSGHSQWISGESSRAIVHQIRGRCDAILVGRGTVMSDDPLLTARPAGLRTPVRIVVDSKAQLRLESQLVETADQAPLWLCCGPQADADTLKRLKRRGVCVVQNDDPDPAVRLEALLDCLGKERMTNVLVEGGAGLFGSLFDLDAIDEVHAFIAPKLVGGSLAPSPIGGRGLKLMDKARCLRRFRMEKSGDDIYVQGRIARS